VPAGLARGLGRAISLALAHAGADVALWLRDAHTGGGLSREIEGMGRRAFRFQMDAHPEPERASAPARRHTMLIDGGWTAR